ncbi:uncharacterized protein HaLaN_19956 [Haematococcus lacustris]|uniref:Choline transporter-like protein n=1 Tax=Haematococcus lacustris TaxID=44745 RepID=A0A6A0A0X2_HAELA|nr:uncharacterized protein HaLaN_19956 [Haematococcus lacustris]
MVPAVLWLLILRFLAGLMAWLTILAVNVALAGLTFYNITASSSVSGRYYQLRSQLPGSGPCYPVWAETVEYFHSQRWTRYVADISKGILIIVVAGLVGGVVLSLLWLLILRFLAGLMAWLTILAVNVALAGLTLYSFALSGDLGKIALAQDAMNKLPPASSPIELEQTQWRYIGIGVGVVAALVLLLTLLMISRIRIAVACIKVASQAIGAMPSIMFFPLLPFVFECIMWCLEKIVAFINRNAYIMVAVKGTSYCVSAGRAVSLIVTNVLRIAAVNFIGSILIFLGKVAVAATCGIIAFAMSQVPYYTDSNAYPDTTLSSPILPIAISIITGFAVAELFFSVYEMAIDTIMLAFFMEYPGLGYKRLRDKPPKAQQQPAVAQ